MTQFRIVNIIKVLLGDVLLELIFNVEKEEDRHSFKVSISDDGETILFSQNESWISLNDIKYEAYSALFVDDYNDELLKLINKEIKSVKYGVGQTLDAQKAVMYYFKIITDENEFLFFNNGDRGSYSFDNIEGILANDIYGYQWVDELVEDN